MSLNARRLDPIAVELPHFDLESAIDDYQMDDLRALVMHEGVVLILRRPIATQALEAVGKFYVSLANEYPAFIEAKKYRCI